MGNPWEMRRRSEIPPFENSYVSKVLNALIDYLISFDHGYNILDDKQFKKTLLISGVGYKVAVQGNKLVMNLGFTIRGMDLVIESGKLAAETIIAAKEKGDFSASTLSAYKTALDNSFVMRDMKHFSKMPKFIENHRIFGEYPGMLDEICSSLFIMYGEPPQKLMKTAMGAAKKVGILNLLKDVKNGLGAI